MMTGVGDWRGRSVAILLGVWVAVSGIALSWWLVTEARRLERALEGAARSIGASADIEVDLLAAWPQLALLYAAVVGLPVIAFWLMWRRARRIAAGPAPAAS
ncbi:MAG TPA: hypothetical protein VEQ60_27430 [Longimicrobium sp.]|nr:hypothetical protein [Longimicrobium sp.]